jgi:hypothetical protein
MNARDCKITAGWGNPRRAFCVTLLHTMVKRYDRLLAHNEEPPLGSHLVTPRLGFAHHGIYVGNGKVVHYGGLGHRLLRGPVEEVSFAHFMRGRRAWVRTHELVHFGHTEVIRRARSRVGENCYRVFSNNCEHFCEWCLQGEHRSYQVESLFAAPRIGLRAIRSLLARALAVPALRIRAEGDRLNLSATLQTGTAHDEGLTV